MRLAEKKRPLKASLLIFLLLIYYRAESERSALTSSDISPCIVPRRRAFGTLAHRSGPDRKSRIC